MTRVVVVGSGIAGLVTAIHASDEHEVVLVTKDVLGQSNTRYAQGGIAGVMFDDDSVESHVQDTLTAGAGLCDEEAVRVLCSEGPDRIRELIAYGVGFDRAGSAPDAAFAKGLEAAHSYPRVLHSGGDATGAAIEAALVHRVRETSVAIHEHTFLVDLLVEAGAVRGVLLRADGEEFVVRADAVVLATGGAGQLYPHTTNPLVATGDGAAAALRAGAALEDVEFVQFHPTALTSAGSFLVSEAVRGEGAVLRDASGERFMQRVHPDAELAPRDVVARGIAAAMAAQGGLPVVLDATMLGAERLATRFPGIDAAVRASGIDWSLEPVPVAPAAHYWMGGVRTDLHARTSLPWLYAVGEVARTGVHGANRLASNSLLEGAVFGARAAAAIGVDLQVGPSTSSGTGKGPVIELQDPVIELVEMHRSGPSTSSGTGNGPVIELVEMHPSTSSGTGTDGPSTGPGTGGGSGTRADGFSRAALHELLWRDAGLIRTGDGLAAAAGILDGWAAEQTAPPTTDEESEDQNLLLLARAIVAAALQRTESRGAHARSDFPLTDPIQAVSTTVVTTGAAARTIATPSLVGAAVHVPSGEMLASC
ncbi:L-aspartate oxidase [Plantibacter sp. Mn2098]|uniref:L-aspartate oxidase n=1 Tax=Plantibacter sp. Mn2098 TaxID=3395266 RepID=UPI003BCD940A